MKIVYLAAGAGAMYCGSCLHGNTLAAALCAAGQDCLLAPLYTPLHTDEENVGIRRVAFGGINVYLQERWALFRHTPWAFDRLWNWPPLAPLGRGPQRQRASRTSRPADRLDARRRARPAAEGGRETSAMARARRPAGHRAPEQRPADRRRPANHPPVGRAGRVQSVGRRQLSGKAARAVPRPGPRRVAAARRRSGRAGGHERLLCRVHGRVPSLAARRGFAWFPRA